MPPHRADCRATLQRLAAFLWALYSLPTSELAQIAWRFGSPAQLGALHSRVRSRIDPTMRQGGRYPCFTDMHSINALKLLSRGDHLPRSLRVVWGTGFKRQQCSQLNRVSKGSGGWNNSVEWQFGMPHQPSGRVALHPYCFVHLQGPAAKARLLRPMLQAAGVAPKLI